MGMAAPMTPAIQRQDACIPITPIIAVTATSAPRAIHVPAVVVRVPGPKSVMMAIHVPMIPATLEVGVSLAITQIVATMAMHVPQAIHAQAVVAAVQDPKPAMMEIPAPMTPAIQGWDVCSATTVRAVAMVTYAPREINAQEEAARARGRKAAMMEISAPMIPARRAVVVCSATTRRIAMMATNAPQEINAQGEAARARVRKAAMMEISAPMIPARRAVAACSATTVKVAAMVTSVP